MAELEIRTALVTGASAGLGAEFARQLAAAGSDLILVARREDRLVALAGELEAGHRIKAEVLSADLSEMTGVDRVAERISRAATLDLLVNNAGTGGAGPFSTGEPGPQRTMLQVHVAATVDLTRAALDGMLARGRGAVINVASVAAFAPFAWTMYGATKAFLVSFSQNLSYELAKTGVRVQALCPGLVLTELHDVIGVDRSFAPKFMWMKPSDVVRASLKSLRRGRVVCVPGLGFRLLAASLRCPPSSAVIQAAARLPFLRRRLSR